MLIPSWCRGWWWGIVSCSACPVDVGRRARRAHRPCPPRARALPCCWYSTDYRLRPRSLYCDFDLLPAKTLPLLPTTPRGALLPVAARFLLITAQQLGYRHVRLLRAAHRSARACLAAVDYLPIADLATGACTYHLPAVVRGCAADTHSCCRRARLFCGMKASNWISVCSVIGWCVCDCPTTPYDQMTDLFHLLFWFCWQQLFIL